MAGVIFAWPLARPFCRVSQIHPQISSKSDSGEIQSLAMPRTRHSLLQVQVFARTAGVIFAWPLARAFCRVSQIHPQISSKSDSGEIQTLALLRTRLSRLQVHVFTHTAGDIFVRPPARVFYLVLQINPYISSKNSRFQ